MTSDTPKSAPNALPSLPFRIASIGGRAATHVKFAPDAAARKAIARELDLLDLPQMLFDGEIRSSGKRDMELTGKLTAVAIQPCSITLEPVRTRIVEAVLRRYLADYEEPKGDDIEIPYDDTEEALGEVIDAAAVSIEALALALPLYPRAPGVELGALVVTPPEAEPLADADLKPFANLAKLIQQGKGTDDKE